MKYNLLQEIEGIKIEVKIETEETSDEAKEIVLEIQDMISYSVKTIIRKKNTQESKE